MSQASSPTYTAMVQRLRAKANTMPALSPTASPARVALRQSEYELTVEILEEIKKKLGPPHENDNDNDNEPAPDEPPPNPVVERALAILPDTNSQLPDFQSPAVFRDVLLGHPTGKTTEIEDAGFRRLIAGFKGSRGAWVGTIQSLCHAGQLHVGSCIEGLAIGPGRLGRDVQPLQVPRRDCRPGDATAGYTQGD
jgi:hypothetical protein